jgi:thioredoxin reductase (NADPH)
VVCALPIGKLETRICKAKDGGMITMSTPVIVYSSTGCPKCHQVKEQLKEWGIAYEERNISDNKTYFEDLQQRKIFGTPATFINNKPILGFQPAKLMKALGLEEASSEPSEVTESIQPASTDVGHTKDDIFQAFDSTIANEIYDFVVIGAGPAGASAALYAARGRLKTLVLDKAPTSGTLAITHKIANYPGVRKEVTGLELLLEMQRQAKDFSATFVRTQVTGVDFGDSELKKIITPVGIIQAKSVFIGVGAKAPSSKIRGEEEFTGRGVSYCSTCDAAFFENKLVVVVGDNEEAIHEAGQLAKFCKEVRLLLPTGLLKGDATLEELESKTNVHIYKKHRVKEIHGEHAVDRIVVQDDQRNELTWDVDGVFLYLVGMKPGTDFIGNALIRDSEGYITVDDQMKTSVDGVFAGGDARRTLVKQAVISAADGCIAALGAEKHVNKRTQMRPQYS